MQGRIESERNRDAEPEPGDHSQGHRSPRLGSAPRPGLVARATVARIVDGDTLDLELRLPFRVRLLDCWASERNTDEGKRAKDYLGLLAPRGSAVVAAIPSSDAKSLGDILTFGRVLGRVYLDDGAEVSALMVEAGHATEKKPKPGAIQVSKSALPAWLLSFWGWLWST